MDILYCWPSLHKQLFYCQWDECFFLFIFDIIFNFPNTTLISTHSEADKSIMTQFSVALVGNWSTKCTSVSLLLAFDVFCLYWSKPKRSCHHFRVLTPKIRTSPNYFSKSLLNVLNLFCCTNCLQCFSHFHMLTHSLRISFNPSLVAGFFREIRT